MRTTTVSLLLCWAALAPAAMAQNAPFDLRFDTAALPGLPGLHSFVFAEDDGRWLVIGGRRDGLHPKFGGFEKSSANRRALVVDFEAGQVWQANFDGLPDTLADQLGSANAQFFQKGSTLFVAGGYGRSEAAQQFTSHPYLTKIDVPKVAASVIAGQLQAADFQQIRDSFCAVAGGQLAMSGDTFLLVGGHRFEGVYSAQTGSATLQYYTEAIRRFTLAGGQLSAKTTASDPLHLHRRDFNLVPQIFENGQAGWAAFAGVFQPGVSLLPFTDIVEVTGAGHAPVTGFNQILANYTCARLPVFEPSAGRMHTVFFGGMSRFYPDAADSLVKDARIPFVKTVSRVSRLADGSYEEAAFKNRLPFFTGTNAEFFPKKGLPLLAGGILDLDALPDGEQLIGWVMGGIEAPEAQPNPFTFNATGLTKASPVLVEVFLTKNPPSTAVFEKKLDGRARLSLAAAPNPAASFWEISADLPRAGELFFALFDAAGRPVAGGPLGQKGAGPATFRIEAEGLQSGAYFLRANFDGQVSEVIGVFKN